MSSTGDPRTFLAAERSLLAWNRTCLAMMGLGFVIERFGLLTGPMELMGPLGAVPRHPDASYVAGLLVLGFASLLAVLSTVAFREEVNSLPPEQRRPSPFAALGVVANLGVAGAGVGLIAYVALAAR